MFVLQVRVGTKQAYPRIDELKAIKAEARIDNLKATIPKKNFDLKKALASAPAKDREYVKGLQKRHRLTDQRAYSLYLSYRAGIGKNDVEQLAELRGDTTFLGKKRGYELTVGEEKTLIKLRDELNAQGLFRDDPLDMRRMLYTIQRNFSDYPTVIKNAVDGAETKESKAKWERIRAVCEAFSNLPEEKLDPIYAKL
ncbi:MAG: hypothetical protein NT157_03540 [Candidatus Micrarchaeota archaeon]|nr:hypothetical protein [Candidatus Micrarchaeota archaeon]